MFLQLILCPPVVFTRKKENETKNSSHGTCQISSAPSPPIIFSEVKTINKDEEKIYSVQAYPGHGGGSPINLEFTQPEALDSGTFGTVSITTLNNSKEIVAIKSVLQEDRFRNRELDIMRNLQHCNIVELKYYFFENTDEGIKLHLILEYLPQTLRMLLKHYKRFSLKLHLTYIRVFMYQLLRGLSYIHSLGICHRDIKPQNLLLKYDTGELKLCDFGSAKRLLRGEVNVSYICSRYYRAPELIFGAINYTTKIDLWSAGCILAEMFLGKPMYIASTGVGLLVEIIKVLGTPKPNQIRKMNPDWKKINLPDFKPMEIYNLFEKDVPRSGLDLLSKFMVWDPDLRITPAQGCCHVFFDELRDPRTKLPNGQPLPPLFDMTEYERSIEPALNEFLIPKWLLSISKEIISPASSTPSSSSHNN